jgi:hypothetical protein
MDHQIIRELLNAGLRGVPLRRYPGTLGPSLVLCNDSVHIKIGRHLHGPAAISILQ